MTQPATPPPDGNTAQVLVIAAITLALIEIEKQVRREVEDTIKQAMEAFTAFLLLAVAAPPTVILTGLELLSIAKIHNGLVKTIDTARDKVSLAIEVAYSTGAQIALTKIKKDLAEHDYEVPSTLPELGNASDMLVRDVDNMFGQTQLDLQNGIREAYDSTPDRAARIVALRKAIDTITTAVQNRAAAAASTAVYRGSTDAQQAIYSEYQNATSGSAGTALYKRWRVTATDPCGMCEALDGTIVGINSEFDGTATTIPKDLRPVWRNLAGPPRHPNCRCQLELVRL